MRLDDAMNLVDVSIEKVKSWFDLPPVDVRSADAIHAYTRYHRNHSISFGVVPASKATDYKLAVRIANNSLATSEIVNDLISLSKNEIDVKVIGLLRGPRRLRAFGVEMKDRMRPLRAGYSVGHYDITAGTLGAFVSQKNWFGSKKIMMLSNNHVLANSNEANLGDTILQPGRYDGGTDDDAVGNLVDFMPIKGSGNIMDAAIASIESKYLPNDTSLPGIGPVGKKIVEPTEQIEVQKVGRTTGHTHGVVTAINVRGVRVNYGNGKICSFDRCIEITGKDGEFSAGGDSGSLVVDSSGNPVGLLFAGGGGVTIINPIKPILDKFKLTLE